MIAIDLIGIGTGNPDHLTGQARWAMNEADLILLPRKGSAKSDLIDLRRAICATVLERSVRIVEFDLPSRDTGGDYLGGVNAWHDAITAAWIGEIDRHLPEGGRLALLVWGDPSLYDSSMRIAERIGQNGREITVRIIPGITSIQALTAAHAIPLNRLGASVLITTGRRLRAQGWPDHADTVVIMLDEGCAFDTLDPEGIHIWWGAYLGMEQEILASGPLTDTAPLIARLRAEHRERNGWIMDIYMMRRG